MDCQLRFTSDWAAKDVFQIGSGTMTNWIIGDIDMLAVLRDHPEFMSWPTSKIVQYIHGDDSLHDEYRALFVSGSEEQIGAPHLSEDEKFEVEKYLADKYNIDLAY